MITNIRTQLSHMDLQVRPGGDIAALMGLAKHAFAVDAKRAMLGDSSVLDHAFIEEHTVGFDAFREHAIASDWLDIERNSGLARADLEAAADVYMAAKNTIAVYGMGLTQHVHGTQLIAMPVDLLLLKGNIGRPRTGMSPVRGHSNVQGQRTVGISEKPELVPLDKIAELFGLEPPRDKGRATVEVCEGIVDGSVKAFVGLGGNFLRAVPDQNLMEAAWRNMELTVQIATKLNRSHLINGRSGWLLPCKTRSEQDIQSAGEQSVSIEDSFSHVHGSTGKREPASEWLLSELAIIAGVAKATLSPHPKWRWDD